MFLYSFWVLIERFADDESWMTPFEALRALHISKIRLWHEAPTLVYSTRRAEVGPNRDFQKHKFGNFFKTFCERYL